MKYIKKFQKENHLVPDGIIGKNTLSKMKEVFGITNNKSLAHFLGQIAIESAYFTRGKENLNYSSKRLRTIFGRYFTYQESIDFARQPEKIANRVYDDRGARKNKLGNIYDGDGWKFIGRGAGQITGRDKYQRFANFVNNQEIMVNPEIVEKQYFWETALFIFNEDNIWQYTRSISQWNIKKVTRIINGGYNGLEKRKRATKYYYQLSKKL